MEDLPVFIGGFPFVGIEIRAVHEGVVNTVLVGLRGLVGQLYREDNAHKVRRVLPAVSAKVSMQAERPMVTPLPPAKRASG
jgi:hypothetical protein